MNCAEMKFKTIYRSWTFALFIYQTTVKVINSVLRDRAGRRKSHVTWLSNWGTRLLFICPHGESLDTRRSPVTRSKEKNNNKRRTKDRKRTKKNIITSDWNRIHKEMRQPEQRSGNLDASTLSETWHLKQGYLATYLAGFWMDNSWKSFICDLLLWVEFKNISNNQVT